MSKTNIPLHSPPLSLPEIAKAIAKSGGSSALEKCEAYLTKYFGAPVLLTTTCTHAMEIVAEILELKSNDEIIVPSFTYASSVQPFLRQGAKIVFADIDPSTANIDIDDVLKKITKNTRAIVVVHYGGFSSDMEKISQICRRKNIELIEDCAQSMGGSWNHKLLGTYGSMSVTSFDKTKNITCDKGGALVINQKKYLKKAEIIRANGSNVVDYKAGKVSEYEWVGLGSQYSMGELAAKVLFPQLSMITKIVGVRKKIDVRYRDELKLPSGVYFLKIPPQAQSNYHIFALVFDTKTTRTNFIKFLKTKAIETAFHYQPLHGSPIGKQQIAWKEALIHTDKVAAGLVRLPVHTNLTEKQISKIISSVNEFFAKNS
jgi:dTDP-4-amino-4,6-dideoxygalactose transaminase